MGRRTPKPKNLRSGTRNDDVAAMQERCRFATFNLHKRKGKTRCALSRGKKQDLVVTWMVRGAEVGGYVEPQWEVQKGPVHKVELSDMVA